MLNNAGARSPNSFIFAHVFTEKHMCQRLAPPNGLAPLQWEILDLALHAKFQNLILRQFAFGISKHQT